MLLESNHYRIESSTYNIVSIKRHTSDPRAKQPKYYICVAVATATHLSAVSLGNLEPKRRY